MSKKIAIVLLFLTFFIGIIVFIPGFIFSLLADSNNYTPINGKIHFFETGFGKKSIAYAKLEFPVDKKFSFPKYGSIGSLSNETNNFLYLIKSEFDKDEYSLVSKFNLIKDDWGGFWIRLVDIGDKTQECDLSGYKYLYFKARVNSWKENPKRFKLQLKYINISTYQQIEIPVDTNTPDLFLSTEWHEYIIDLHKLDKEFMKRIIEICVLYEKDYVSKINGDLTGMVLFDGFEFKK